MTTRFASACAALCLTLVLSTEMAAPPAGLAQTSEAPDRAPDPTPSVAEPSRPRRNQEAIAKA
jgi:hypothetical protein